MPIYRRDYEIIPWQETAPDNKWYEEYIWKEPVDVSEEVLKTFREAYFMYQKIQQQQVEVIGEIK